MSTSSPSFGVQCALLCKQAAKTARESGHALQWDDVAPIIDAADKARKGPPAAKQSKPSPFGDRKGIPPTPEQVTVYSASIGYAMDGQAWCDSYAAKGWMVGKVRMKDWQAAVRNWARNGWGSEIRIGPKKTDTGRDYTSI